jgi:hypothetical protein
MPPADAGFLSLPQIVAPLLIPYLCNRALSAERLLLLFYSFGHADSTRGTDKATEVTAYALGTYQTGTAGLVIEDDGLMTAVATRHLTASATDTQFLVELWINDGIAVQAVGMHKFIQPLTHQFL